MSSARRHLPTTGLCIPAKLIQDLPSRPLKDSNPARFGESSHLAGAISRECGNEPHPPGRIGVSQEPLQSLFAPGHRVQRQRAKVSFANGISPNKSLHQLRTDAPPPESRKSYQFAQLTICSFRRFHPVASILAEAAEGVQVALGVFRFGYLREMGFPKGKAKPLVSTWG